jgi:hypothetical protein
VFGPKLPVRPANHGHQLRYLFPLIGLVAAGDRVFDAMRHVILQHLFLDAPERGSNRRYLRDDIDAVAILVDHLGQAADLAFDPAQAFLAGSLDVFSHPPYIPLEGMGCKWRAGEFDDRSRKRKRRRRFKGLRVHDNGGSPGGNGEARLLRRRRRSHRSWPWRPSFRRQGARARPRLRDER